MLLPEGEYYLPVIGDIYLELRIGAGCIERTRLRRGQPENLEKLYPDILSSYRESGKDVLIPMNMLRLGDTERFRNIYDYLIREVTFGRTITYSELGRRTGFHPRAVGVAMRLNRFPLLIPCHRVISKRGIGGFSQGLGIKEALLLYESSRKKSPTPHRRG